VYPPRLYATACDGPARGAGAAAKLSPESSDKGGTGPGRDGRAPPFPGAQRAQKKAGRRAARLALLDCAGAQKLSRAPSWMRQRDIPFSMLKPTGSEV
jgi:hypothetical protein